MFHHLKRRVLPTAAIATSLLFLGAKCNCQIGGLDTKAVEKAILEQNKASGMQSVKCPDSAEMTPGFKFECTYKRANGPDGVMVVTMSQDGKTWEAVDKSPPPAPPAPQNEPAQPEAQEEDMAEPEDEE